ncbi:hypothetical protein [Streptomyces sp. NPDC057740]|uniref:hypothetical protein n=1 Tax=Streptomyces sp. NPDC057740 TaxID=3346234 RepID=UPI0036D14430
MTSPTRSPGKPSPPVTGSGEGPDTGLLDRAHALLADHPVADGYSGLPWALRHASR